MSEDESGLTDAGFLETVYGMGEVAAPARRIGRFRILQKLGEGGMGVVYEAEQVEPVRRRVALKVIKAGMDTQHVIRRFESERQALALMDHPAIARVYDAGATQDGRPFFAMELVQGVPITQYCDQYRLTLAQRLELFVAVCEGIQHAHQKGIIHRDIKPSNVLVREQDGRHVPKIIDFGVAKAVAQRLTEGTFFTELGQLIGTPEYMSPEQAEMSGLDVDTRTDVYLLGVMLYELLTGELPFGPSQLREVGFDEFRRRVIHDEPARPSQLRPTTPEPARARSTEPKDLPRLLSGDLDWITMKALEKDRTRRYASASEFARDVERHLRHEPVVAGPPSNLYKMRKFVRRHRTGVAFAAVVVVLLAGFAVNTTLQRARLARENERANAERDRANQAAATASRISAFLVDLFKQGNPDENLGQIPTARELLDRGAAKIHELEQDPVVRSRLLHEMATAYSGIGLQAQATEMLEAALEARRSHSAEEDLEIASLLEDLGGHVVFDDPARAHELFEDVLEIRTRLVGREDVRIADVLERLGNSERMRGDDETAAGHYREAFEIRERLGGADDPALAPSLQNLGIMLKKEGQFAQAEDYLLRALRLVEGQYDKQHPDTAYCYEMLARLYEDMGELERSADYYGRALEVRRKIYGDAHWEVASSSMSLAVVTAGLGRSAEAARLYREALPIYERSEFFDTVFEQYKLARYQALTGHEQEALRHLRRACVELDHAGCERLLEESSFRSLHGDPAFRSIVDTVARRQSGA